MTNTDQSIVRGIDNTPVNSHSFKRVEMSTEGVSENVIEDADEIMFIPVSARVGKTLLNEEYFQMKNDWKKAHQKSDQNKQFYVHQNRKERFNRFLEIRRSLQ